MIGNNLALLYDHVEREVLPAELGGDGPPYHMQSWAHQLIGKDERFSFGEKQMYWPDHGSGIKWVSVICINHNRAENPAICLPSRIFAKASRMFCFISEEKKFAGNLDNFQLYEDILWAEAVRKCIRHTPAMFSTPSDCEENASRIFWPPF